jgi:cobalt-zinc-cadmium efflux system outer membrane protein
MSDYRARPITAAVAGVGELRAASPALPDRLSLQDALQYALRNHPRMRRASLLIDASDSDIVQARLRPNPQIQLAYKDEQGIKDMFELSLGVKVELGGKRRARADAARARAGAARTNLLEDAATLTAAVRSAFATLAYAQKSAEFSDRLADTAEESLRLVASLRESGRASEVELLIARGVAAVARAAAGKARARFVSAEREALISAGIRPGDEAPVVVPPTLETPDAGRSFRELETLARKRSPILLTARALRAIAEAKRAVAYAGRLPDLSWVAGGGSVDLDGGGGNSLVFGRAALELPIFDRNQGAVRAAAARAGAARAAEDSRALSVASTVSRLLAEVEGLGTEVKALEQVAVPSAEKALAFASDELKAGRISRLKHLKLEASRLKLSLRLAKSRHALRTAVINIELVTGTVSLLRTE